MLQEESDNCEAMEDVVEDEDEDDKDDMTFENERCGICRDVIIDRGVLDCCDDWFCFICISNWAAITSCCPLCKNKFQRITCLPVFDTTGSIRIENSSLFTDVDWSIQTESNALSFPSYYIDEDAIICLDADGCKVRNGLSIAEDDLSLDTSVACDSCDIWYHACCVGFNPEAASGTSWLCPRCIPYEELPKSDLSPQKVQEFQSVSKSAEEWVYDPSLLGRVSVAVDDGETAVVVSIVPGEDGAKDITKLQKESETSGCNWIDVNSNTNMQVQEIKIKNDQGFLDENADTKYNYNVLLETSTVMGAIQRDGQQVDNKSTSSALKHAVSNSTEEKLQNQNLCESVSRYSCQASCGLTGDISNPHFPLDILVPSSVNLSDDKLVDGAFEEPIIQYRSSNNSETSTFSGNEIFGSSTLYSLDGVAWKDSEANGMVAKQGDKFGLQVMNSDSVNNQKGKRKGVHVEMEASYGSKKAKSDENLRMMSSGSENVASASSYFNSPRNFTAYEDKNINFVKQEKNPTVDIMSIVQEVNHKSDTDEEGRRPAKRILDKRENAAGLRVKKIMRRVGDREETAILEKEIKDTVRNKFSSSDRRDDELDGKLLSVFREAIVRSKNEVAQKFDPSLIKMKKKLLQKGKVRENLTKKIYNTSNGRRRRAWDRDWEIEFWKYRCSGIKHEKVEMLQSVLELLNKASSFCSGQEDTDQEQGKVDDSILSRVYLADASVFPRKDDIKPLSHLSNSSEVNDLQNAANVLGVQNEKNKLSKISEPSDNSKTKFADIQKAGTFVSSSLQRKARAFNTPANQSSSAKRVQDHKDIDNLSSESSKKKWALEVLAKKNALSSSVKHEQEDGAMLKGNYPLLAQLPSDMRPVPAPCGHNKVPISVRQAQLYRLTEQFLRKTNLTAIQKTAKTELAVIDATNVEKEISAKSNTKMVYMNLCAQYLSQWSKLQGDVTLSNQVTSTKNGRDKVDGHIEGSNEQASEANSELTSTVYDNVEEALRDAGLSDSPPSSPCIVSKEGSTNADPLIHESVERHENVLDVGTYAELDIIGDMNHKSGDLGYSACVAANDSKALESEGNTGMTVAFGTSEFEVPNNCLDNGSQESKLLEKVASKGSGHKAPPDFQALSQCQNLCSKENVLEDINITDKSKSKQDQLDVRFLEESTESRGPEKEVPVTREPSRVMEENCNMMEVEASDRNNISGGSDNLKLEDSFKRDTEYYSINGTSDNKMPPNCTSFGGESSSTLSVTNEKVSKGLSEPTTNKLSDIIEKKVEAFVKEHIRPLCKIGVITVGQYRHVVARTTKKVMSYHRDDKNANFLIKEGDRVKKLAEQYAELAQKEKV